MMKATLQEVALRAGVSISTVSRALSGSARVSPDTRERIRIAVEVLNYTPAPTDSIVPQQTGLIGFVMPEGMQNLGLNTNIYGMVIGAVRRVAEAAGYAVAVGTYTDGREVATVGDRLLVNGGLEGVVVYRTRLADETFDRFRDLNIPFVVINRLFPRDPFHCVGTDQQRCGYLATRHLLDLGHRRIAFVSGGANLASFIGRREGYRRAMQEAELAPRKEWQVDCELNPILTVAVTNELLGLAERPTAIIAANDRTAFVVVETVQNAGLAVPTELSVVGFDDAEEAAYFSPPLTTVRIEWAEMAELATQTLFEVLRRRTISQAFFALEPQLIVRQSTAAPP